MSPVVLETLLLVPLALVAGLDAAADCLTTDSQSGMCVLGTQCTQINRIRDSKVLQKYLCGSSGTSQMLCCPNRYLNAESKPTVGASRPGGTAILESNSEDGADSQPSRAIDFSLANTDCWLPSSKRGKCVPGTDCSQINRIRNPAVLQTYTCGHIGNSRKLCCPLHYLSENTPKKKPILESNRQDIPQPMTGECGKAKARPRIVGGRDAGEGEWPWQALVLINGTTQDELCGGSLVSNKHVLSAAHCFVAKGNKLVPAKYVRVRLGEHDRSKTSPHTVERAVSRILPHENFNKTTFNVNDIALIFMAGDVIFTPYISPICLPDSTGAIPDDIAGESATATGWGLLSHDGKLPDILQNVDLPIWGSGRCWNAYNIREDRERFLCAGDRDGKRDTCSGDSGGPLVVLAVQGTTSRYYQIGITSFGHRCATKGLPGVYTRVTSFLGWINDHM